MSEQHGPNDAPPPPAASAPPPEPRPAAAWHGPPRERTLPARPRVPFAVFLLLGCVVVGACGLFALLSVVGGASGVALAGGGATLIEQTVVEGGDAKVVLLEVEGPIAAVQGGGMFGGGVNLVERVRKELESAASDKDVRALLLSIDSPGGTVTASDQVWHLVQEFKRKTNKPVVVHMGALCASGGYYIAVAGDELICEPTTITGSIGVVLSGMNFHEFLQKHGVADVTITSGDNKDLLNPLADPKSERYKDQLEIIQSMVDETYARFVKLVAEGRKLDEDVVRKLADGRIYTAKQALDHKLVDAIGYRDDALARARERGGSTNARLVRYTRPPTLADVLAGNARGPQAPVALERLAPALLDELTTPRLLALWRGAR